MLPKEREYLVLDNLKLVHHVLQKKLHIPLYHDDYEDYYQEGCIGLIIAAIRFDASKGFEFSTYAASMIMGSIQRYRRDKGDMIRIPRSRADMVMKVARLSSQGFTQKEIKEITGYSYYDIQKAISTTQVGSLDNIILDESNPITLHDMISDGTDYYKNLLTQEYILECISKVTSKLTADVQRDIWEEWVWAMLYGEELRQEYFAKKYNTCQANVSRTLRRCKKLFEKEFYK